MKSLVLGTGLALAIAMIANAQSGGGEVKLTMDEVAFQPIDGLTVKGVTFHDTAGANYDAANGGTLMWTRDPVIEGPTNDVVTIDFPYAVNGFQFSFALETGGFVKDAVSVDLFGPGGVALGTFTASSDSAPTDFFANGIFVSPSNVDVIGRAVVHLNTAAGAPRFALDYLTFSTYNNLFGPLLSF